MIKPKKLVLHRLVGMKEIADALGWSLRSANYHVPEWREAGILFEGRAQKGRHKRFCKVLWTFDILLVRWFMLYAHDRIYRVKPKKKPPK